MPLLYPKLRVTQIFGANTDVGKTLLTTSLLRSTAKLYKAQSPASPTSFGTTKQKKVWYLKPISTGPEEESDVAFVERHAGNLASWIKTKNLYQYREPVSPHLARILAPDLDFPKTNENLLKGIREYIEGCAAEGEGSVWLETAGGVHSPSLHPPHTQIDSLRPLRLPTILIASPHLGGISTTLSSYESLLLRGYSVISVLCLKDPYYKNHEFLEAYFKERGIEFWAFEKPHERGVLGREEDNKMLEEWYEGIEREGKVGMLEVARRLEEMHEERVGELESMPQRTLDSVWWPFTQHGLVNKKEDIMVIDSAKGDMFDAYYANRPEAESSKTAVEAEKPKSMLNPLFDGSASWFTQAHGHANTRLTLAAAEAAGRYGHVLFPSGTNEPALKLAEHLLDTTGKGWASRVFYSDNGSTGMEVGLKMALRASGKRYGWEGVMGGDVGVIGLKGAYHGDTIGSMDAADQGIFNTAVDWYRGRGFWFSPPAVTIQDGKVKVSSTGGKGDWPAHPMKGGLEISAPNDSTQPLWSQDFESLAEVYNTESRLNSDLATYYREHIRSSLEDATSQIDPATGKPRKFGVLVMEPMCLGAGGMVFVDPLFQRVLVDVVRESADILGAGEVEAPEKGEWAGLPVLFDEVFSGLYRLSYGTASEVLGVNPDIVVNAKILSGGLLPLSTTMASNSIFKAFLHPTKKIEALLHGHSYTANPIGCNVCLEALKIVDEKKAETAAGEGNWRIAQESWEGKLAETTGNDKLFSLWSPEFAFRLSKHARVNSVMTMGTVLAIELRENAAEGYSGYASSIAQDFLTQLRNNELVGSALSADVTDSEPFSPFRIHSRPLGNVIYMISSLFTERNVTQGIEEAIERQLSK